MRTALRRLTAALCWSVAVAIAVVMTVAYAGGDTLGQFGFMARTLTFHAGLVLLVVTGAALGARAHRAGWAALVVAFVLLAPTLWRAAPKAGVIEGESLAIASCNTWSKNATPELAAATMLDSGADVICFQEYTPQLHALIEPILAERYPHRVVDAQQGFYGSAIYSRRAMTGRAASLPRTPCTVAEVRIDGRAVRIYNIHLRHHGHGQALDVAAIESLMRAGGADAAQVFIGDYNFTEYADAHAKLERAGYRDVLDLAGRGLNRTWPRNRRGAVMLYPGFRIDHAYLSPALTASHAWVGDTPGSDHRHVVARIGFGVDPSERAGSGR